MGWFSVLNGSASNLAYAHMCLLIISSFVTTVGLYIFLGKKSNFSLVSIDVGLIDAYYVVVKQMSSGGSSSVLEVGQIDILIPTPDVGSSWAN